MSKKKHANVRYELYCEYIEMNDAAFMRTAWIEIKDNNAKAIRPYCTFGLN
jgi:hypothetical protein